MTTRRRPAWRRVVFDSKTPVAADQPEGSLGDAATVELSSWRSPWWGLGGVTVLLVAVATKVLMGVREFHEERGSERTPRTAEFAGSGGQLLRR